MVDLVVSRPQLKKTIERTLRWFETGQVPERRTGVVFDETAELPQTD
jgi:hypothetical protein